MSLSNGNSFGPRDGAREPWFWRLQGGNQDRGGT